MRLPCFGDELQERCAQTVFNGVGYPGRLGLNWCHDYRSSNQRIESGECGGTTEYTA